MHTLPWNPDKAVFQMVEKRLGFKWSGFWIWSVSLTIWNPSTCRHFFQKLFKIGTKMSGFGMVQFLNGWDHNYNLSLTLWKPDNLKSDLQKEWILNGQISDPNCIPVNPVFWWLIYFSYLEQPTLISHFPDLANFQPDTPDPQILRQNRLELRSRWKEDTPLEPVKVWGIQLCYETIMFGRVTYARRRLRRDRSLFTSFTFCKVTGSCILLNENTHSYPFCCVSCVK